SKVEYLENISAQEMHLFHLNKKEMKLVAIRVFTPGVDLTTAAGFNWFKQNFRTDAVEIMVASKEYTEDKNLDKFQLIEKGGVITKGELFRWFEEILP